MYIYELYCDIIGYTDNERKRDEYKEFVEDIDAYLKYLKQYISDCRNNYSGFEDVHAQYSGANSYGEAIDIFKKESAEIHKENLSNIKALDNAYEVVSLARAQAQTVYENCLADVAEDERLEDEKEEKEES